MSMLENIKNDLGGLPASRKMALTVVAGLILASLLTFVYLANQEDYRVLFSNLSSEDAASIVTRLKEKKIPYQLSPAGDIVSVPSARVAELRLEVAAAGLLHGGGVGFEIFDNKVLGATDFEQQLNYRRALQGELARTINSLEEIQQSRVHIALPKESLFVGQQKQPTASITLKLKQGKRLSASQIEGIGQLVASSVEGLRADDVIIVDSQGNMLSRNQGESRLAKMSSSQIEYQRGVERELGNQIQTMLESVVGPNKAVVRVNAELDFRITEKTEETYDPESPVVRSTQKLVDRSSGAPPPPGRGDNAAPGGPEKEKTDETINYEINRVVSKTVMPVGEIRKISIAVLVDGLYGKDEKGALTYQERPKKEIDSLEELVRKSAGLNPQRGDQVVVTSMAFSRPDADQGLMEASWQDRIPLFLPVVKYVVVLIGILLLLFIIRPLVQNLLNAAQRPRDNRQIPPPASGGGGELNGRPLQPQLAFSQFDEKMSEVDLARQLAGADAKKFAELLRNWLK
jgi:flagellar M-ring protein FliF